MLHYHNELFKDRIILKNRTKLNVSVRKIILLEGNSNYTTFVLDTGGIHRVSCTLKHFSLFLENQGFCRVNRGILINFSHVKRYDIYARTITMSNEMSVKLSRRRRDNFVSEIREKVLNLENEKRA